MKKITKPISILEFGSTHIHLAIYEKSVLNQSLFYEEKIDYTRNENTIIESSIINPIIRAEKDLGQHLNEVILMIDSNSISTLDFSTQKNFDKKLVNYDDIDYLIKECEQIVKINNKDKEILHVIIVNIIFDDNAINDFENISQQVQKAVVELKFIIVDKKISNFFKDLFLKKHISIKNIFCTSYIKSLGHINKIGITGHSAFIDIGLKKSSITIFRDSKLIYLNNTHVGSEHVTKDISKILNINYRNAESKKFKFSKKNKYEDDSNNNDELLKKIINARLEEIVELLFLNCPLIKDNIFNSELKLFFIGNGSRALSENLLSFGSEFNFINEMSIINEGKKDCCDSAIKFTSNSEKIQPQKINISLENKGFFEKLFEYFSRK